MSNSLVRGTIIIVAVGIVAKFLSFIAEAVLAATLGTSYQGDAYYMISGIQVVIYPMLSVGIWKVFLPLYKDIITTGNEVDANHLANKVISFVGFFSLLVIIVLILFSTQIVSVIAPGFDHHTKGLCSKLVRYSSAMYIFIAVSAVYSAMLQSKEKFFGSQIREAASHIPTIFAALFFYHYYGVETLAIALVVAGVFRLIVQLPFVSWGYRYKLDFHFKDKQFCIFIKRLPSALLSEGATQINCFVDKVLASTLPIGAVSCLNYGSKLNNFFSGMLSTAVSTALFPKMIELMSQKKMDQLSILVIKIVNTFALIMIPASLLCCSFCYDIVEFVFQRGAFNTDSTETTAGVFAIYSLGILFTACYSVIVNIFYGWGDTKTPMYISFLTVFVNIILNIILIKACGIFGLALATSIAAIVSLVSSMLLVKKIINLDVRHFLITTGKIAFSSAICFSIPVLIRYFGNINYIYSLISVLISVIAYYYIITWLKIEEAYELKNTVYNKLEFIKHLFKK